MKRLAKIFLPLLIISAVLLSASAAFTPSAEQKTIPTLVATTDAPAAVVTTAAGEVVEIPQAEIFLATPNGDTNKTAINVSVEDQKIIAAAEEKLSKAYEEIANSDSVTEVIKSDALNAEEPYVVSQMFDITPVGESAKVVEEIFAAGKTFDVNVALQVAAGSDFRVATLCGDEWVVLREDQVVLNADGTYTLKFEELCPIAIIQTAAEAGMDAEFTPATSDASNGFATVAVFCMVSACAVGGCAVALKKSKKN